MVASVALLFLQHRRLCLLIVRATALRLENRDLEMPRPRTTTILLFDSGSLCQGLPLRRRGGFHHFKRTLTGRHERRSSLFILPGNARSCGMKLQFFQLHDFSRLFEINPWCGMPAGVVLRNRLDSVKASAGGSHISGPHRARLGSASRFKKTCRCIPTGIELQDADCDHCGWW